MRAPYKTIALCTEYDPAEADPQLKDLRFHAENEFFHCSSLKSVRLAEPEKDRHWDRAELFDEEDHEGPSALPDDPGNDTEFAEELAHGVPPAVLG